MDLLVNNATGWVKDTFAANDADRHCRSLEPLSAVTWDRQFKKCISCARFRPTGVIWWPGER